MLLPGTFVRLRGGDYDQMTGVVLCSNRDTSVVQLSARAEAVEVATAMLRPDAGRRMTWTKREAAVAA